MANSILTIDMITRKCLEILENNLVLTRNVNRQYDDSFAVEGAKISDTTLGNETLELVKDGAIRSFSVGFIPVVDEKKGETNKLRIEPRDDYYGLGQI